MAKSEDDVRGRLQRAALELFGERGYDGTTTAEIAALAGVTERTFFRHFLDKREVLFGGEAILRAALTAAIADAPNALGPLDTLFRAFRSVQPLLEANRPFSKPRQTVIAATPALYERDMAKMATLADALAAALKDRGVADLRSVLAARTAMAAFAHATISWLDDPGLGLGERIDLAARELKGLFAGKQQLIHRLPCRPVKGLPLLARTMQTGAQLTEPPQPRPAWDKPDVSPL